MMLLSVVVTVLVVLPDSEDETVSPWLVSVLVVVLDPVAVSVEVLAPVISLPVSLVVEPSVSISWLLARKSVFCELVSVSLAVLLSESVSNVVNEPVMLLSVVVTVLVELPVSEDETVSP